MAKILRWKEKLALACFTLLFSIPRAWAMAGRGTRGGNSSVYLLLVTRANQRAGLGFELTARRPFVRLIRTSRVALPISLAPGALIAMAAPLAAPAPASSCKMGTQCNPSTQVCTNTPPACGTIACYNFGSDHTATYCYTCGRGTCFPCPC